MNKTNEIKQEEGYLTFERYFVSIIALLSGIVLIMLAVLGPMGLNEIVYKTSPSAEYQTIGQDITNLVLLAPLCIIGGVAHVMRKPWSKYFLILTPIYLMYMGLSYGIGMEWSSDYVGNSHHYFALYLALIIGGLILMIASLPMFSETDAPSFSSKPLKTYVIIVTLVLVIFANMWFGEVNEVIRVGDTSTGSYSNAPTVFWVIRYLDLGVSIPVGLIAMYLLWTRPSKAYPIVLLFYGFFITMITAVNAMGYVMLANNDPEMQAGGLVLFGILALLCYSGYFYLVKDKIRKWQH